MTGKSIRLSDTENDHLVRAIEAALKVGQREAFHAWIGDEFHALLPYENLVCLEIDEQGNALLVECLQHNLVDASKVAFLHNAVHALALRLVRALPPRSQMSHILDAAEVQAVLALAAEKEPVEAGLAKNAVIHRIRFLSGTNFFLVLFNMPPLQVPRSLHLFKLLSSHVKMALSWAVSRHETRKRTPLSCEIVRLSTPWSART